MNKLAGVAAAIVMVSAIATGIGSAAAQPYPSHPIYYPPGTTPPEGGDGAHPEHPIVLPPDQPVDPNAGHTLFMVYMPPQGGKEGQKVWFMVETVVPPPPEAGPKA